MKQAEYRAKAGWTQEQRILAELAANPGRWVGLVRLWKKSGAFAVHSRVSDLRGAGHVIEHKNLWQTLSGRRRCRSFYRLENKTQRRTHARTK